MAEIMTLDEIACELSAGPTHEELTRITLSLVEHVRRLTPEPVVEPCARCESEQEHTGEMLAQCETYSGSGAIRYDEPGLRGAHPCPKCKGRGTVSYAGDDDTPCPSCPAPIPSEPEAPTLMSPRAEARAVGREVRLISPSHTITMEASDAAWALRYSMAINRAITAAEERGKALGFEAGRREGIRYALLGGDK